MINLSDDEKDLLSYIVGLIECIGAYGFYRTGLYCDNDASRPLAIYHDGVKAMYVEGQQFRDGFLFVLKE